MAEFDPNSDEFLTQLTGRLKTKTPGERHAFDLSKGSDKTANKVFYEITLGNKNWRNGKTIKNGIEVYADNPKSEDIKDRLTPLGGWQINFFIYKTIHNQGGGGNPFKHDTFLKYMLLLYSNIKIDDFEGKGEKKAPGTGYFQQFSEDKPNQFNEGAHTNIGVRIITFANAYAWKKSDVKYTKFWNHRISPHFFGGAGNKLFSLFKQTLEDKKPNQWSSTQRRLFLLMGGKYYGENDVPYLNLMKANGSVAFKNIPKDVVDFWKENHTFAEQAEAATAPKPKGLEGLEKLVPGGVTLENFAKQITHGTTIEGLSELIKPYNTYEPTSAPVAPTAVFTGPYSNFKVTLMLPNYVFGKESIIKDGARIVGEIANARSSDYQNNFPKFSQINNEPYALTTQYQLKQDRVDQIVPPNIPVAPLRFSTGFTEAEKNLNIALESVPSSSLPWIRTKVNSATIIQNHAIGEYKSPAAGPLFKVPADATLLQYADSKDALSEGIGQAVANLTGAKNFTGYAVAGMEPFWKPFDLLKECIINEFKALQDRLQEAAQDGSAFPYTMNRYTPEGEIPETQEEADTTINPDYTTNVDPWTLMWVDAVNAAARKAFEWVMVQQANTEVWIRWLFLIHYQTENKSTNEIAEILKKVDLGEDAEKVPTPEVVTPYNIPLTPPPEAPPEQLTEDEIKQRVEKRRKNIDQCLLSTNIDALKLSYRSLISKETASKTSIHKNGPFDRRFHLLEHSRGQHSSIPNYLGAPPGSDIAPFLQMTPDIMSALTPKIRLFRVVTDLSNKDIETEFVFTNYVTTDEVATLQTPEAFEKGRGGGIKSFSFSYEGGTPATAKKDIQAELVLFFQSFNELTKERGPQQSGKRYRYIDLLLYPNNQNGIKKSNTVHPNQFMPSNFRIRADVGWNLRHDDSFKRILNQRGIELPDFNKALSKINKTFLLNMIDHDIDFRNDGTVEIKITYAAYIESETRSASANALSTPQIEDFKKRQTKEINNLLKKGNCQIREINAILRTQAESESAYIRAAQGSIGRRMILRGLQRSVTFDRKKVQDYLKDFATAAPQLKENVDLNSPETENKKAVKFYFLGDLIYTLMDCLYETPVELKETKDLEIDNTVNFTKRRPELRNFVPLLSSMIYSDYNKQNDPIFSANIADIPISVQYFNEWFVENVIKPERTVYPLMDFIRDLLKAVIDLLTDACINRQIDTSLMFQTSQYTVYGKKSGKSFVDPLTEIGGQTFQVDKLYESKKIPFITSDTNENGKRLKINNYFNYTLMYPVSPTLSAGHKGTGIRSKDEKNGIYHFQIGSNKGLLKTVNFSKTDMAYLREARFYNQGNYGLLQLGAVYNVTLQLFGNTLFYPGMEIFIDPRSFGGPNWDPTVGGRSRSVANALGIGGYHTITKVTSKISPSGFNTTVEAVFQYSGDVASRSQAIDGAISKGSEKPSKITDKTPPRSTKCAEIVNKSIERSLEIAKMNENKP